MISEIITMLIWICVIGTIVEGIIDIIARPKFKK